MIDRAADDVEGFWEDIAKELHWFEPWDKVYEEGKYPFFRWFVDGKTNLSHNCLDYQVSQKNRGDKAAIIWESGEKGKQKSSEMT